MTGIFDTSVRSAEDYGGVFELEDGTAYFYLYAMKAPHGQRVVAATELPLAAISPVEAADVEILWDDLEEYVAVFIKGVMKAAYEIATQRPYNACRSEIPDTIKQRFI